MKRIARSAIVECSAGAFYALVEDIEAYPVVPALVRGGPGARARARPHRRHADAGGEGPALVVHDGECQPARARHRHAPAGRARSSASARTGASRRCRPMRPRSSSRSSTSFPAGVVAALLESRVQPPGRRHGDGLCAPRGGEGAMASVRVEVVYALADAAGSWSVAACRKARPRRRRWPRAACPAAGLRIGIGGQGASRPRSVLRDGDRVEILRPLALDPKEARRRRARRRRR